MQLSNCLKKYKDFLDPQYENLGKTKDSFLKNKILLEYSDKNGWDLKNFDIFKLFFRNYLGFYQSTHLNHIIKHINQIDLVDEETIKCHAKIFSFWMKKNLVAIGNCKDISKASVICFAEEHMDEIFRGAIGQIVNKQFHKNDVILVEGLETGKQKKSKDHQQAYKIKDRMVQGWEPQNFMQSNGSSFQKATKKYIELKNSINEWQNFKNNQVTNEEIKAYKPNLDLLIKNIQSLNHYYHSDSIYVLNAEKILQEAFKKLEQGTLSKKGENAKAFYYIILRILMELEKQQEHALYKNMNKMDLEAILNGFHVRNESLVTEIKKFRKKGRKIFIISGASHLLQFPQPYKSCDDVKNCLRKDSFILITKKSDFKKIAKLNEDLKKVYLF